jgi:hypothetical protein
MVFDHERGYLLILNTASSSLQVIDMNTPAAPVTLGTLVSAPALSGVTAMLALYRSVVVASGTSTALQLISTHVPTAPVITATVTHAGFANVVGLASVTGAYVFAACVTDTSIKAVSQAGVLSSLQDTTKFAGMKGLEKTGVYLITVGTTNDWLTVIDASNPNSLEIIGSLTNVAFGNCTSFKVDGDYVGIATSSGTIIIVSIADLTAPVILYTYTNTTLIGTNPVLFIMDGIYYVTNSVTLTMTAFDFRSDTQVHFDQQRFDFDGYYDTDSRICLEFYGPATLLALTYQVDDTDNPPNNRG